MTIGFINLASTKSFPEKIFHLSFVAAYLLIINALGDDRWVAFSVIIFPTICAVFPTGFYKSPTGFGKQSLAFTLQMQGIVVKSRGIVSRNGRGS